MYLRPFLAWTVAIGTLFNLAACGQPNQATPAFPATYGSESTPLRIAPATGNARPHGTGVKRQGIAITSENGNAVVLDSAYQTIETLTNGLNEPAGDAYDAQRHLYVANYGGDNVTEYNHSGRLIFTYSTDVTTPASVAVDDKGNVYVANGSQSKMTSVVEFPQRNNTPSVVCDTDINVNGITVDDSGNVFVVGNWSEPKVVEYAGGLSGCSGTELGAESGLADPLCITLDKNDDLVVGESGGSVAVIDPPYSSVSSSFGAYDLPTAVSLSKSGKKLYVADFDADTVWVVSYPDGTTMTKLGPTTGVSEPVGVAAFAWYNK